MTPIRWAGLLGGHAAGARRGKASPLPTTSSTGNMLTMLLAGEDTTAHSLAWTVHIAVRAARRRRPAARRSRPRARQRTHAFGVRRGAEPALLRRRDQRGNATEAGRAVHGARSDRRHGRRRYRSTEGHLARFDVTRARARVEKFRQRTAVRTRALAARAPCRKRARRQRQRAVRLRAAHLPRPFARAAPGMRVVLATLVRNFDLERIGSPDAVTEHFSFTVSPRGLRLRLRMRGSTTTRTHNEAAVAPSQL